MAKGVDLQSMRGAARRGNIQWQRHVLERMAERGILRKEVKEVLSRGERIEDYPEDHPFPSALFMGMADTRPIHVVAAFNPDMDTVFVITVYEPSTEFFEPDFQTRRKT